MALKSILPGKDKGHEWTFASIGGVTRVTINNGDDIAHLDELDQKLWTVLSCPVKGLEFDEETLRQMDFDDDDKIRVNEVVATAKWLTGAVKDSDKIIDGVDHIALADLDDEDENGAAIIASAKRMLARQNLEKDEISLDDVKAAKKALEDKVKAKDDAIEATVDHRPYGDKTDDAIKTVTAIKDKVADYFMRCKLIAFDEECSEAVDVSVEKIQAISELNLATCSDQIASYPLARPNKELKLFLNKGVNPAWQATFAKVRDLTIAHDYPEVDAIDEAQWNDIVKKLDAYVAGLADDKEAKIESFDKETEEEAADIKLVNKFLLLYRDFYKLLKNYVVFADFYTRDKNKLAVFQAGQLFIDQRCCELCIKVTDMSKHAEMAVLSGMFLIYCHCTSKVKKAEMDIVAALTDGDIDDLRVGKNAVFYDRSGQDWDATVTKIVDNPISIRQAFFSPYKKLGKFISDKITKNAADKEAKKMEELTAKADTATDKIAAAPELAKTETPAKPEDKKAQMFDIAKFAGIFAAIGLAIGAIGGALAALGGFVTAKWYNIILLIAAIVIFVSGPSMFLAWLKLRKRNLGPVLNANGWAINAQVRVNTAFGATLTTLAKYPLVKLPDPYADKKMPFWKKCIITLVVLIGIFCALYFTNSLKYVGLPFKKEVPESVDPTTPDAEAAEAPAADAPAAEAPAAEAPADAA
ncbi:MAG: hypothetical protein IIY87_03550 [Bacteroidales bacterium]|nr:hypothetical protein [Bacteroidales bacterium]